MTDALLEQSHRDHMLPSELRWLVSLRWFAATAIVIGALAHGLFAGWSPPHGWAVALGVVVVIYNAAFRLAARSAGAALSGNALLAVAGAQIMLDLVALTLLALWTGGAGSPLLGLFVLHMVFASLLLPPLVSYGVAAVAVGLMLGALALTGHLPREPGMMLVGWTITLLLAVFLTGHITAQLRRRETQRREQQRHLQAILDTAADSIITIDEKGVIQSANPATTRIFGYDAADLIGRNLDTLIAEPDRAEIADLFGNRQSAIGNRRDTEFVHDRLPIADSRLPVQPRSRELLGQRNYGDVFPIELAMSEVVAEDRRQGVGPDAQPDGRQPRAFTAIIRDISNRKRRERELEALHERLLRQQQALFQSEKMAAMGRMAAGIAHEIGNPLASLDSVLQLARRKRPEIAPKILSAMQEQVGRIDQIARELTAFAHPNGSEWQSVPLKQIVCDALHMLRFEHRMRSVEVRCICDPDAGEARIMPQSMQQVLVNLILNALDAMEHVDSPRLTIRTFREDDWRIIEISDNGPGIEAAEIERIFEPFFTTKPPGSGTGLGLSISTNLIQRQNGRLEATSAPGQGATFRITLPASQTATAATERPADGKTAAA